ncbi:hypothetical protein AAZV13_01G062400 [Glycine max]
MSQCVPSWDVEDNPPPSRVSLRSNSNSTAPDVPMLDYEVAELTWENGQLSMHGLGLPRVPVKPPTAVTNKYTWEKPRASGTLESIVNQVTSFPHRGKPTPLNGGGGGGVYGNFRVPWFDPHATATTTNTVTMDALVPCSNREQSKQGMESVPGGTCMVGCSTRVGSCCGGKGAKGHEATGRDQSVSGSATFGRDSKHVTLDTCDREFGVGFTSTSINSLENTSSAKHCTKTTTVDDHDSVSHSKPVGEDQDEGKKKRANGKSSVSTKRSRAAAIHNQSERKRRDKINQRMKTLQKLVPNSSKVSI